MSHDTIQDSEMNGMQCQKSILPRFIFFGCAGCGVFMLLCGLTFVVCVGVLAGIFRGVTGEIRSEAEATALQEHVVAFGRSRKKILLLRLEGIIQYSQSRKPGVIAPEYVLRVLKRAQQDANVEIVILDINSPGGEVNATAEIHHALKQLARQKRVIAFFRGIAASGGYYIATACHEIYANPNAITGSIGVMVNDVNVAKLLEKIGVRMSEIKSGEMKDMGSPFMLTLEENRARQLELLEQRERLRRNHSSSQEVLKAKLQYIDDELKRLQKMERHWIQAREILQKFVDECYGNFVKVVAEGRKIPEQTVRAKPIGDARIFSASEAMKLKLIDGIRYYDDLIDALRKQEDYTVVRYSYPPSLTDILLGRESAGSWKQELENLLPPRYHLMKKNAVYYICPLFIE